METSTLRYIDPAARYEKERIRKRTKYLEMSTDQRDALLYRVREYKKRKRTTCASSDQYDHAGVSNIDEDSDVAGIFEPMRPDAQIEENMGTSQEGETVYDDEEEESSRFSAQDYLYHEIIIHYCCESLFFATPDLILAHDFPGNDFESYRVTTDGSYDFETHDPYDYVYHNLPTKHHVLKPVKDSIHCGAIRFQYEGPAFCCRKGKVKVFIPEVPQELQRLFPGQVDEDAKYFR
ncbi:uncharacterized protein [Triticum aestivum]|uniref:uncharacterized protein n=1 Tax=Triticum aestivum TaxID=4565 RepID=UPI001D00379A|nr:uncharacterized protein LOC123155885 [Triticum aestivum]